MCHTFALHVVCYASLRLRTFAQGCGLHVVSRLPSITSLLYMLFAVGRPACVLLLTVIIIVMIVMGIVVVAAVVIAVAFSHTCEHKLLLILLWIRN